MSSAAVRIQDKDSQLEWSVVVTTKDVTKNQIVVGNVDGTWLVDWLVGFNIPPYDYISLWYTGANLTTVIYKLGGSGGATVATLTLWYDGSNNLTSVTKS